jgi:hypothetical protein
VFGDKYSQFLDRHMKARSQCGDIRAGVIPVRMLFQRDAIGKLSANRRLAQQLIFATRHPGKSYEAERELVERIHGPPRPLLV